MKTHKGKKRKQDSWILAHNCGGLYIGSCDNRTFVTANKHEAVYWDSATKARCGAKDLELAFNWHPEMRLP